MLRTFGELAWLDPTTGETQLGAGKPLALLAYLACHAGWATRDELIDLLWSNLAPERGRHALRQTLHSLRRLVGPEALDTATSTVRLSAPCRTDRDTFLTAVHEERYRDAIAVYQGRFLAGIAFPGGMTFEGWRDLEAARLTRMWESASEGEVRRLWATEGPGAALDLALALQRIDTSSVPIRSLLVETYLQLGNIQFARSEADELVHLLHDRGLEPTPSLVTLLAKVSGTAEATSRVSPRDPLDEPELVGRSTEFSALLAAWQRARIGSRALVHIEGDAGIGKSRLISAFGERLAMLGVTCIRPRAFFGERHQPLAAIATLVEQLAKLRGAPAVDRSTAALLVRLVPQLRQRFPGVGIVTDGIPEPLYLISALADLIHAVADEGGVAILLDDVHWLDRTSAAVLAGAVARLDTASVALVTAGRGPSPIEEPDVVRVQLEGLPPEAVGELVSQLGEADPTLHAELVSALTDATRGSPLFVIDSLRSLLARGTIRLEHGRWTRGDPRAIAAEMRSMPPLQTLVRDLEGPNLGLLRRITLAGQPLPENVLSHGLSPDDVSAGLSRLEQVGLVRDAGWGWEVSHDLVGEWLVGTGSLVENRAAHRALVHGWLDAAGGYRGDVFIAAIRHAAAGKHEDLFPVIGRHWYELARREGRRLDGASAIRELAQRAGTPDSAIKLLAGLPWHRRHASLLRAAAAGAVVLLLVLGATRSPLRPEVALRLEGEPLLGWSDSTRHDAFAFIEPITVVAQAPDGTPDSAARGRVSVHVVGGKARLTGPTVASLIGGVARLDSVHITPYGDSVVTLQVRSAGGTVIATRTFWTSRGEEVAILRLTGGRLNGIGISPDRPTVLIRPGEILTGHVELRFRTDWLAAAVMLCGITTWERGMRGTTALSPLPTPVQDGRVAPTIRINGPTRPGRYHLILAARAESGCHWIGSLTNWEVLTPSWNDGNDVADLTKAQLRLAQERGVIRLPMHNKRGLTPASYGIQSIEVVVRP